MKNVGFTRKITGEFVEHLPIVDGFESVYQRRAILLELINANLPQKSKIDLKKVNFELNIYEILLLHIKDLSQTVKSGCSGCGCTSSSLLKVQHFFNSVNFYIPNEELIDKNICAASKVIDLLNISAFSTELKIDLDKSFTNLVYQRMIAVNNDKTLICHSDKIEVKSEGRKALTIYPKWQDLDSSALYTIDEDIEKAGQTISNHCNQVYLVFPKGENFQKHVKVLHTGIKEDEEIKVIPYSFSFCNKCIKKTA